MKKIVVGLALVAFAIVVARGMSVAGDPWTDPGVAGDPWTDPGIAGDPWTDNG